MKSEQKQIENAMVALREAYDILNDLLPKDAKQEQFKPISKDYASERILKVVRLVFNIDPLTKGRHKDVIEARHAYRYLLRKHTRRSTKSIAILTDAKDHTSILNSINKAESFISTDKNYAAKILQCEIQI